ncbi:hypothetical protein FUAX_22340 [Fulvitalea axinellae]|uniref:AB hydrolase-1 domain-containing protein n=1 Tax=Fulvitalea axinellae TaxID=1182444 RepID=A0AAU9CWM2_9BACT|nr:hypothetical protein FUAX_22340 [Fulvitalea axinellae]
MRIYGLRAFWGLTLLFIAISMGCSSSQKKSHKKVQGSYRFQSKDGVLHYVDFGGEDLPVLLLVHGSPGDYKALINIANENRVKESFRPVLVDRPGYGETKIKKKMTVADQARLFSNLLDSLDADEAYLLGHSYGGAVVAEMLTLNNPKVKGALLLAPTLSPKHQKRKYYNYLAKGFSPVLSRGLASSNKEMWTLSKELESLQGRLNRIRVPVLMMHGEKDWLVPFATVKYCKEYFSNECLTVKELPEAGHFLPWKNKGEVLDALNELKTKCE